jgi:hypothetical protein
MLVVPGAIAKTSPLVELTAAIVGVSDVHVTCPASIGAPS